MSYAVDVVEPGRAVVARSARRLPFEPSGWLRDFRSEHASACRTLHAQAPRDPARGVYTSPQRDVVDLENVLTYNLGTGALAAAARHALLLERSFDATGDRDYEHQYRYQLAADLSPAVATIASATPLVDIKLVALPDAFREPKAGCWWLLAARAGVPERDRGRDESGFLALTLEITPPAGWRGTLITTLITLLKPVTDGIVSALPNHDGPLEALLDRAGAVDAELSPHEMREYLQRNDAPRGSTRLVWPWRHGLQLSPADERIVQLHIRLAKKPPPGTVHARVRPARPITASPPPGK